MGTTPIMLHLKPGPSIIFSRLHFCLYNKWSSWLWQWPCRSLLQQVWEREFVFCIHEEWQLMWSILAVLQDPIARNGQCSMAFWEKDCNTLCYAQACWRRSESNMIFGNKMGSKKMWLCQVCGLLQFDHCSEWILEVHFGTLCESSKIV